METIHRACEILRKRLKSGAWTPGERLPSLVELAKLCTVSRSTMSRVLDILKKESLLHAYRGGAIVAGAADVPRLTTQSPGYAWERLKDRIGQELFSSALPDSHLHPLSKAARHYGVAIDTLKKALAALVREGLLTKDGRRFRPAHDRTHHYQSTMVLISLGDSEKGVSITDPRTTRIIESFERECSRLGFRSRCEGYNRQDPSALIKFLRRIKEMGPVAGYIINLWMDWSDIYWRRWIDLLMALTSKNTRVVVLDQDGALVFPNPLLHHPRFRVLRIAGIRAGETVGQLLLKHGHRRIAYLMPNSATAQWTQNRFTGLSQCCKHLGGRGTSVELYSRNDITDTNDLTLAVIGLDKQEIHSIYAQRLTNEELQDFTKRLHEEYWMRLKETMPSNKAVPSIHSIAKFMVDFCKETHQAWIYDYMLDALVHIASNSAGEHYLKPFFEMVLTKSSATAWVCAEDKTALWAVHYLRSRGKRVPEDISVIGFENWREAYEQQMSTYDFNMNGMIQQGLLMIMDEKVFKGKPVISEVDGYVVERRTTKER